MAENKIENKMDSPSALSENIFENIFKRNSTALAVTDNFGKILSVSNKFKKIFPDISVGHNIAEKISAIRFNKQSLEQTFIAVNGNSPDTITKLKTATDEIVSVRVGYAAPHAVQEETEYLIFSFQPLDNSLHDLHKKLKHTKSILEITQQAALVGYWEIDAVRNEVTLSKGLFDLTGLPEDKRVTLRNALKIFDFESRTALINSFRLAFEHQKYFFKLDMSLKPVNGQKRWGTINCYSEKTNSLKTSIYGTFQDITETKSNERSLKHSYQLLDTILNSIDANIFVFDLETHDVLFSNKLKGHNSYTPHKKEKCWKAIHGRDGRCPTCPEPELLDSKGNPSGLFIREYTDKKTGRTYLCHDRAVKWISDKMAHLIVALDITDRKKLEEDINMAMAESEAANRSKGEFLANMSHEIRTPLNGIFGMLELLKTTRLNSEQEEYIATANESGKSLLTVINDILDFSKMEAGKMSLIEHEFNLEQCISSLLKSFTMQVRNKKIQLDYEFDKETPICLIGDESRIRQILFNLVGNAVKFTSEGRVHVKIHHEIIPDRPEIFRFIFAISDTGIGIAPDKQKIIFQSFTQIDGSHTRKFKGTGLGLAIVQRLTALLGGNVSVESEEGTGSTFTFSIVSKVQSDHFACRSQNEEKPELLPDLGQLSVLLVEDERINSLSTKKILEKRGHSVTTAENGAIALELLEKSTFDCILMDVQMPVMDGLEATRRIRSLPEYKMSSNTPIIAMTAHTMRGDKEKFLKSGMDGYVAKPIDFEKLITEISINLKKDKD
ncbi:PAS domain-containing hybrid sensor histidine kinase/response regulator [Maridesulfovibrio bastinii]|uniref:PAS domain-containing hybrid sensor histidine kinase/response regulator n=1 Tax=Maridesulfovibrio bastinii TaxID=47157 RepID=UPI000422275D|nr:PAS domain-containing hybrid sensor histidine kinase/response regulator [Maridesulfovibrio bastinii]